MISTKFLKTSFIYSLVGALPMLSGLILLPFYTGDILSEKNYGYLTLHLAFALLFQSIFVFCLDNFIGPVAAENRDNPSALKEKMSAINFYSFIISGTCVAILLAVGPYVFGTWFAGEAPMRFFPFMAITVLTSLFNAYFKLYSYYLIYTEKPMAYLLTNVVNFVATIAVSVTALFWFGDSIMGPLIGRLVSGVIIFCMAAVHLGKAVGAKANAPFFKEIWKFCAPLMIFFVVNWVFNYSDRLFIEKMLSVELAGLFDFGLKCTLGVELLFAGMNHSVYPKLYGLISGEAPSEERAKLINKYASGYLVAIILASVLTLMFVPIAVFTLVTREFYYKALSFLPILVIGQVYKVPYHLYLGPLLYFKRTDLIAKSFVFSTLLQLSLTFVLVWQFQFNGIIMAYIIGKPVQVLFVYRESRRLANLSLNPIKQFALPLTAGIFIFVLEWVITNKHPIYFNLVAALLLFSVTLIFYRSEIPSLLDAAKKTGRRVIK